jgi:hypothetical protein
VELRTTDLRKLNSATKYPSIPTFHVLGDRGRLREEVQVSFGDAGVVVTEKLDGTNTRIIVLDDRSYLIGSREELLHARGDIVFNPAQGIVAAVRVIADRVADTLAGSCRVVTFYGEVYGGKTSGSKAYGTGVGFRLFDVVSTSTREHAALAGIDVTPRLEAKSPPTALRETHAWLQAALPGETFAPLDGDRKGRPEGVVVRTRDRGAIAKLRFEDYERTLR